jgi:hypothetical protein
MLRMKTLYRSLLMMDLVRFALVVVVFLSLSACTYPLTMHSRDGERLNGRWRFAREGTGLIQVVASDGEVLVGAFKPVPRRNFFENYQKAFGGGSIDADGPDLFAYGNVFGGLLGGSSTLADVAYGENYNKSAGESFQTVRGPLLYWTASLQGDRRTIMQCFLIGSSSTGRGLGRCKGRTGTEYTVEF